MVSTTAGVCRRQELKRLSTKTYSRLQPRVGDVYEVPTPAGRAYIQYTHDHEDMGQLIRILPGMHEDRPLDLASVVVQMESYFTFYSIAWALENRCIEFVGNFPIPPSAKSFPTMRHGAGIEDAEGKVSKWFVGPGRDLPSAYSAHGSPASTVVCVTELTPEQRRLSEWSIVNHTGLVHWLTTGWLPELDEQRVRDARRSRAESKVQVMKAPAHIEHFLYFPRRKEAENAGQHLRRKSFDVSVIRSADQKNWLVLARSPIPASEEDIEKVREEMEALAERLLGQYDGWGMPTM